MLGDQGGISKERSPQKRTRRGKGKVRWLRQHFILGTTAEVA